MKYYEDGQVTNKPIEFVMAEMVREKVFRFTEQEVPHSITCVVDSVEVGKTSYHVHVSIIVDRDSLKKIIIGSKGSMLKKIGTYARKDLENLLGKKVYLDNKKMMLMYKSDIESRKYQNNIIKIDKTKE